MQFLLINGKTFYRLPKKRQYVLQNLLPYPAVLQNLGAFILVIKKLQFCSIVLFTDKRQNLLPRPVELQQKREYCGTYCRFGSCECRKTYPDGAPLFAPVPLLRSPCRGRTPHSTVWSSPSAICCCINLNIFTIYLHQHPPSYPHYADLLIQHAKSGYMTKYGMNRLPTRTELGSLLVAGLCRNFVVY